MKPSYNQFRALILSLAFSLVAKVNEYACKSLDQLEEKLPFLQQPTEKVSPPAL